MKQPVIGGARRFGAASFVGGELCLDFANSVDNWLDPHPTDKFASPADWLAWCASARLIGESEARALHRSAQQSPAAAAEHLERVRSLRNALYRAVTSAVEGRAPARADVALLDAEIGAAHANRRIAYSGGRYQQRWNGDGSFDRLLWPIAVSAESLLLDPQRLGRVHRCPARDCGWLFLDSSRNRSRRWCSMRTCGNLAKAHRHYARVRLERLQ
jgi:predicted RNA-binding Zn ribbon-like protein